MPGQSRLGHDGYVHVVWKDVSLVAAALCLLSPLAEPVEAETVQEVQRAADLEADQQAKLFVKSGSIYTDCTSIGAFNADRYMEISILRQSGIALSHQDDQAKEYKLFLKIHKKHISNIDTIALKSWKDVFEYVKTGKYIYHICHVDGTSNIPSPQHVAYLQIVEAPINIYFISEMKVGSYRTPTGASQFSQYIDTNRTYTAPDDVVTSYTTGRAVAKGTRVTYVEVIQNTQTSDWLAYHHLHEDDFSKSDGEQRTKKSCLAYERGDINNNVDPVIADGTRANYGFNLDRCILYNPNYVKKVVEYYISH